LLPWDRFEALVALLEEKGNKRTVLTPAACDHGIDVISIDGKQVLLIQCKHTNWDAAVDGDIIEETINALDSYRGHWLRAIADKVVIKPALVTNGKLTRTAVSLAANKGVQIMFGKDLWKLLEKTPCSLAEVEMMESRRLLSMKDVKNAIDGLLV